MIPFSGELVTIDDTLHNIADSYGIRPEIHAEDYIFHALYEKFYNYDLFEAARKYYLIGHVNAGKIADLATQWLTPTNSSRPLSVMDFASGYGCVARHLCKALPDANCVAVDIHEKAVAFNRQILAVESQLSASSPQRLHLERQAQDVVFALSFFSHIPKRNFVPWLRALGSLVREEGLLIFSTHGRESHRLMPAIAVNRKGYGFAQISEQKDLPTSEYGMTVTYPPFVLHALETLSNEFEIVFFSKAYWWTHQDCFVLRRLSRVERKQKPSFLPRVWTCPMS